MSEVLPYESLHNHTVISDGQQTHFEVLEAAQEASFGVISFTDHDILPREKEFNALRTYDGPVAWNIGIEISSGLPNELGGGPATLFHILGLRIDHTNDRLRAYCDDATLARLDRLKDTVNNLRAAGFTIKLDDCIELAGEGAPGSPHVSRALVNDSDNVARLEAIAEDMRQEAANDSRLSRKYDAMMQKVNTGQRHPYIRDLLFADDAYVPGVYVPYEFSLEMDKTVSLIRAAGGLAIIAHWPSIKDTIDKELLTQIAADGRIDGLELRTVFNANPTIDSDIAFLKSLADKYGLVATVGVDGHEPKDFTTFSAIPGALEMTVGQWEKIVPT